MIVDTGLKWSCRCGDRGYWHVSNLNADPKPAFFACACGNTIFTFRPNGNCVDIYSTVTDGPVARMAAEWVSA
jgi:hypothetical protein